MDREQARAKVIADISMAPTESIGDAIGHIDRHPGRIALVVDDAGSLIGTVVDGDVRRAILAGLGLDTPVSELLRHRPRAAAHVPITAPEGTSDDELRQVMREHVIRQVPIVDAEGRVRDLVLLDDLTAEPLTGVRAVVMAGGFGKRLRPLTENIPKPMLPVGDRPVIEHIVGQLRDAGVKHVNITTHFMPEKIKEHFGDGSEFGVHIDYVSEGQPLGTAGSLGLMIPSEEPLLVINGDILTDLDFRHMLAFHREHEADLTVGVRQYDMDVPYGVVQTDGVKVTGVTEKPRYTFFVNAGIYLLEPLVQQAVPESKRYDMTDLIEHLVADGRSVVSFPIIEYWLDIGKPEDYRRAEEEIARRTEG